MNRIWRYDAATSTLTIVRHRIPLLPNRTLTYSRADVQHVFIHVPMPGEAQVYAARVRMRDGRVFNLARSSADHATAEASARTFWDALELGRRSPHGTVAAHD